MDNVGEQIYKIINDFVFKSKNYFIQMKLDQYMRISNKSKDDLVSELYINVIDYLPNTLENAIERFIRKEKKDNEMYVSCDVDKFSDEDERCNCDNDIAYDDIINLGIFNYIDVKVLSGELSRSEAAVLLGKSYGAYTKSLSRKKDKLLKMLSKKNV